jgi:cyclophilin family peptidyl-prolyl cis-trans isomerase/HEAT repeat protein
VEVRREAAVALREIPASISLVRARLDAGEAGPLRATLLENLGFSGDASDLGRLRDALGSPRNAEVVAAARALGRLGVRKVPNLAPEDILGALLGACERLPIETRRASAFALARIEARKPSARQAALLRDLALHEPDPIAQAFLVRAAAVGLEPSSWASLEGALREDPDPGVRVALARGIGRRATSSGAATLLALTRDPEHSVRVAALEACAAVPPESSLISQLEGIALRGDPEERGLALAALSTAGRLEKPRSWLSPDIPLLTRILLVEAVADPTWLLEILESAETVALRTAALGALLNLDPPVPTRLRLLGHTDPIVAAAAATSFAEKPSGLAEKPLLRALHDAKDRDLLVAALQALAATYAGPKPLIPRPGREAALLAKHHQASTDPGVTEAARGLAEALMLRTKERVAWTPPAPLAEILRIRAAVIETDRGTFVIALEPEEAPYAVWSFAHLADQGFYDGLSFHRVVSDFVLQGGDPRGDGWGGPGFALPDEFGARPFESWAVGMASSGPDTAGSQFFVTLSPQPHLDGRYTRFGRVSVGRDVARSLQRGDIMRKVRVERAPGA